MWVFPSTKHLLCKVREVYLLCCGLCLSLVSLLVISSELMIQKRKLQLLYSACHHLPETICAHPLDCPSTKQYSLKSKMPVKAMIISLNPLWLINASNFSLYHQEQPLLMYHPYNFVQSLLLFNNGGKYKRSDKFRVSFRPADVIWFIGLAQQDCWFFPGLKHITLDPWNAVS